jgi:hypothetical protein
MRVPRVSVDAFLANHAVFSISQGAITGQFSESKELHIPPETLAFYPHPLRKAYTAGILASQMSAALAQVLPVSFPRISI